MDRFRRPFSATVVALSLHICTPRVCSFFPPAVPTSCLPSTTRFCPPLGVAQDQHGHPGPRDSRRRSRARGGVTMERASGKFNRLAKPAFDRENPNAVLGEVKVPGLEQVGMLAQTQIFPKREAVQMLKESLQTWCAEENRREAEGVHLSGGVPREGRARRRWRAYEFTALPSRNRTLDSEILGMNVGRPVNDTRLEVTVDFGQEAEAREVGMRLLDMMAHVSSGVNKVFGYADDASSGGQQLGPWKKPGAVSSWRKWLEMNSGEEPLPEAAVTVFRTVQANWASPEKIAAAMNFTVFWSNARMEESMADPTSPLRRVEVLHSALHPHVIKILETFESSDAMLDHFHRNYEGYLEGVFDFRAAVNPTVQAYTPLDASLRPCLSATLFGGAMVPLVAIGGAEDGAAPSTSVLLEGLKLGARHVVLNASSPGVQDAVEGLTAALAFGVVKRHDLFVTMMVGESNSTVAGGAGLAVTVRETLASGRVPYGGSEEDGRETRLLDSVDALVLVRESGEHFDDDHKFLEMWEEAHQAAASPPRKSSRPPTVPTKETNLSMPGDDDPFGSPFGSPDDRGGSAFDGSSYDNMVDTSPFDNVVDRPVDRGGPSNKPFFNSEDDDSLADSDGESDPGLCLARHLGVGGHGPLIADRLALLVDRSSAAGAPLSGVGRGLDTGTAPPMLPSLFFGELRAGDGATTAETMELCREKGVQAFSLRYVGGQGGEEARKGAAAAADFEYEDVTGDEVLAKWIMELGGGVVWRPREPAEVARTLPLARYFLPPEWITEIVSRGGCPPEAWARTLSRLCPPEGTPTEDEIEAEVDRTVTGLMALDDEREEGEGDGDGFDGDSYDGLWDMDDDE